MSDYQPLRGYQNFNVRTLPVTENFAVQLFYQTAQIKIKLYVKTTKERCPLYLNLLNEISFNNAKQRQQFVVQYCTYTKRKLLSDNTTKEGHQFLAILLSQFVRFTQYCLGDKIEKNGVSGTCSMYGGQQKRRQCFGGETSGKEPTWKTQVQMGG